MALLEAKVLIESRRNEYNHIPPHSSVGYRPLATVTYEPATQQVLL